MTLYIIFFTIIFFNLLIFKFNNQICEKLNLYDRPDFERKIHLKKIPVTGGIFLFANIILFILVLIFKFPEEKILFFSGNRELFSFIFLITSLFLIGLYDDRYNLKPFTKLFVSTFSVFIFVLLNENIIIEHLSFETFDYRIYLSKFAIPFTILSILIFLNALNMFDGIDLQVSTYVLLILIYLLLKFDFYFLLFLFPVFFFNIYFNYKKRNFLGDSGTNILAGLISFLIIKTYNLNLNLPCEEIFLLMLIPGLDLLRLFIVRIINGKNPFLPDQNHLHHLYLKKFNTKISFIIIQLQIFTPILLYNFLNFNLLIVNSVSIIIYILVVANFKFTKNF